jgi:squalene synthase HpnC
MQGEFSSTIETPSGKDEAYENFPVGSWLLPASTRPHVAAFYAFARAADDIADNPRLTPEEKVARLDGFEAALLGRPTAQPVSKAARMRDSLAASGIDPRHCYDLLQAFKLDATKLRYRDWDDLIGYCLLSAAPVGRFLLDLHGGSRDGYVASDALCMALQVINHLQDCGDDYRQLDRVYLPTTWFDAEGATVDDLGQSASTPALRRVIDRAILATRELMKTARPLPAGLRSRRLAMEAAGIVRIADRLLGRLEAGDPLGPRLVLSKWGYVASCLAGMVSGLRTGGGA